MKLYIKGNTSDDVVDTLEFEVFYTIKSDVTAAIKTKDGKYYITVEEGKKRVWKEIKESFYSFVKTILNLFEQEGFFELDSSKSPKSDSLYFTFCYKNDAEEFKVNVIFYMRVSDHTVPEWDDDKSVKDSEARMHSSHVADSRQYRVLNDDIDSDIDVVDEYVEYDGTTYIRYDLALHDVRRKLRKLKQKYSPTIQD